MKLEVKNDATNGDNVDSYSVSLIGIMGKHGGVTCSGW